MSYAAYLDAEKKINQGLIRRDLSLARGEKKPADPPARMAEIISCESFVDDRTSGWLCGSMFRSVPRHAKVDSGSAISTITMFGWMATSD